MSWRGNIVRMDIQRALSFFYVLTGYHYTCCYYLKIYTWRLGDIFDYVNGIYDLIKSIHRSKCKHHFLYPYTPTSQFEENFSRTKEKTYESSQRPPLQRLPQNPHALFTTIPSPFLQHSLILLPRPPILNSRLLTRFLVNSEITTGTGCNIY